MLIRHPMGECPEVEIFHQVTAETRETVLSEERFYREEQATRTHKFVLQTLPSSIPKCLKMNAATPTLQEIEAKADAYIRAKQGDESGDEPCDGVEKDNAAVREEEDDDGASDTDVGGDKIAPSTAGGVMKGTEIRRLCLSGVLAQGKARKAKAKARWGTRADTCSSEC